MPRWPVVLLFAALATGGEVLAPLNHALCRGADGQGFTWDIQPNDGQIGDGTNDCFDGGLLLTVDQQNWQATSMNSGANGTEVVLGGALGNGLVLTRRIRLLRDQAAMRYIEVLENPGAAPVQVQLTVASCLGGSANGTITTGGQPFGGGRLGPKDLGVFAQQSGHRPSVLFVLAGPRAPTVPSVMVSSHRQYFVSYPLTVKPRSRVAVVHLVAQRRGAVDAGREAASLLKSVDKLEIPSDLRRCVVNLRLGGDEPQAGDLPALAAWCDRMTLERGAEDLLLTGGEGRQATGAATGGPVVVTGGSGRHELSLAEIAALAAGPDAFAPGSVWLRNGEVLRGRLAAKELALASTAGALAIDPGRTAGLLLRVVKGEGVPRGAVLAGLPDGEVLALAGPPSAAPDLVGPFGRMPLALDRVARIDRLRDGAPAWRVAWPDGTRLTGVLIGGEIRLPTRRAGTVAVRSHELSGWWIGGVQPREVGDEVDHATTTSGDIVAGLPVDAALTLATTGGEVAIETARLQALSRGNEEGEVVATLAGGAEVAGRPLSAAFVVASGAGRVAVPWRLLEAWRRGVTPEPPPAPATDGRLARPVSVRGDGAFAAVAATVATAADLRLEIAGGVVGPAVSLQYTDRPLAEVLDALVAGSGLGYRIDGDVLRIEPITGNEAGAEPLVEPPAGGAVP